MDWTPWQNLRLLAIFLLEVQNESPLVQLTKEVLKRPATTVEMSCVRRLFSESYANIAADIKNAVEATDDMPTRKLAPAERADRLRLQQQRLSGINISGPYEPGDDW